MSKVVVLQSNYLPWKGYFHLIQMADTFVFYDDVQFTKNDWRNRNLIKSPQGPIWISVPCGQKIHRRICDVEIADSSWQLKHWNKIQEVYGKSPFFPLYSEFFESFYRNQAWKKLTDLNQFLIREISKRFLGLNTKFENSLDYPAEGTKDQKLYNLLKVIGAKEYISGPAAKSYLDETWFEKNSIKLTYIDYSKYPEYPQLYPPFSHQVSIVDLLFQVGTEASRYVWGRDSV